MSNSTIQESAFISRRDFVNLASKASASVVTGVSGGSTTGLTPMRNSKKSYEDSGTLAAMQAASATEEPNIDEYRTHAASLPKLSIIDLTPANWAIENETLAG